MIYKYLFWIHGNVVIIFVCLMYIISDMYFSFYCFLYSFLLVCIFCVYVFSILFCAASVLTTTHILMRTICPGLVCRMERVKCLSVPVTYEVFLSQSYVLEICVCMYICWGGYLALHLTKAGSSRVIPNLKFLFYPVTR